ncbi:MAG: RDD family protein, partial [Chitinophagales bacterium]
QQKSEYIYTYPKADGGLRLRVMVENVVYTLVLTGILSVFAIIISSATTVSLPKVWLGIAWGVFVIFRTGNQVVYFEELAKATHSEEVEGVFLIDVKTNTLTKRWKKILRRNLHLTILFICYYYAYLNNEWMVIVTLTFGWNIVRWMWSKSGRTIVDYLLDTQMVNYSDFKAENYQTKPSQSTNIYPIADAENRVEAASMDGALSLFSTFITILLVCFFIENDFYLSLGIGFLVGGFFWTIMESWNDKTLGKASTQLMIVDVKTNAKAKLWKILVRRAIDVFIVGFLYFTIYYMDLAKVYYIVAFVGYLVVNFVVVHLQKGSRLGDYLVGTQVINVSDFEI